MKKLILGLFAAFIVTVIINPTPVKAQQIAYGSFIQTNLHTVATNITWNGTNVGFSRITLIGMKAGGVSNAAPVFVGAKSNETYYVIGPGERHIIEISPPTKGAVSQTAFWWLRTPTTGDGLYCIWNP